MFKRDRNDTRSARQVRDDISHDLYHKVAKFDKSSSDGKKNWRHGDDCEWKRANGR